MGGPRIEHRLRGRIGCRSASRPSGRSGRTATAMWTRPAASGARSKEASTSFLSRPRRFGKSLPPDTIKEAFEGSEALFRGLAIHDGWDCGAEQARASIRRVLRSGQAATQRGGDRAGPSADGAFRRAGPTANPRRFRKMRVLGRRYADGLRSRRRPVAVIPRQRHFDQLPARQPPAPVYVGPPPRGGSWRPVGKVPRVRTLPGKKQESASIRGCGALFPRSGGPNRLRDSLHRLSRDGRTLPAPLPGGATRRVHARGAFSTGC